MRGTVGGPQSTSAFGAARAYAPDIPIIASMELKRKHSISLSIELGTDLMIPFRNCFFYINFWTGHLVRILMERGLRD